MSQDKFFADGVSQGRYVNGSYLVIMREIFFSVNG